jgi:hypothetical protein
VNQTDYMTGQNTQGSWQSFFITVAAPVNDPPTVNGFEFKVDYVYGSNATGRFEGTIVDDVPAYAGYQLQIDLNSDSIADVNESIGGTGNFSFTGDLALGTQTVSVRVVENNYSTGQIPGDWQSKELQVFDPANPNPDPSGNGSGSGSGNNNGNSGGGTHC